MPLPQHKAYTIEDIFSLPEGTRAELIDGQIYYMAPPSRKHQQIAGKLFAAISHYIDSNGGSCEPYIAPFAVFLNKNDKNYVEPDISVICDPDKLNDRGCNGAPDWIIEIVSPGSRQMDYFTKLFKKEVGQNIKSYILQVKVEIAKDLLGNPNIPISMVALDLGYSNFSHFTQVFKKLEGITPTDYRKNILGDNSFPSDSES